MIQYILSFRALLLFVPLLMLNFAANAQPNIGNVEESLVSVIFCSKTVFTDKDLSYKIYDQDKSICARAQSNIEGYARNNYSKEDAHALINNAEITADFSYYTKEQIKNPSAKVNLEDKIKSLQYCRRTCTRFGI